MNDVSLLTTAATHQIYALERRLTERRSPDDDRCDRGAVSLEQVLWFVAAGVSVAVIAAILWGQIRDTAEQPVSPPAAP